MSIEAVQSFGRAPMGREKWSRHPLWTTGVLMVGALLAVGQIYMTIPVLDSVSRTFGVDAAAAALHSGPASASP